MSLRSKCQQFIKRLGNHSDRARDVWGQVRKRKQTDGKNINEFLTIFMENQDYQFLSKGLHREKLKTFLDTIFLIQDQYQFGGALNSLRSKLLMETAQLQINGQNILIKISYNTTQIEKKYSFRSFVLEEQIQKYVKTELTKLTFHIRTQTKSIRILEGKQETKDNYVGTYIFDPFFNCVKIQMRRLNDEPFIGKFKIQSSNINKFNHIEDTNTQTWINETDFDLNDPIEELLAYIFEKENASPEDEELVRFFFQKQGLKIINDLSYDTDNIIRRIPKHKWAKEVQAQFQKINGLTKNYKKGRINMHPHKEECMRLGNSHKILRYVFYMTNNANGKGLYTLNKNIPLLSLETVQKAIQIVQTELIIKNLFPQLRKCFKAFCITDSQKIQKGIAKLGTPNGILFYGPPGTGKTRLTQDLAELMGMNPISVGLPASEFMKELVGQAKGVMRSYLQRSKLSPHLICSISIDQFDAIFGNRRCQYQKNGETVATMLALVGGNQNIENLLVFGSTNFRNYIDTAILRRFTPNFYVGLPSLEDRRSIIRGQLPNLGKKELNFLSKMTPNFSGAALINACAKLALLIYEKKQYERVQAYEMIQILQSVGENFKIKFGRETYPHLHRNISKEISMDIMRTAFNNFVVVEKQKGNQDSRDQCKLVFVKQQQQWSEDSISQYLEIKEMELSFPATINLTFQYISSQIESIIHRSNPQMQIIVCDCLINAQKYHLGYENPTLLIVSISDKKFQANNIFLNKPQNNLYVICCAQGITGQQIFKNSKLNISNEPKLYSGRLLVDLTNKGDASMIFERVKTQNCPITMEKTGFMQSGINSAQGALPEVVEFLMSQQVDYIPVIDSQLMSDNNAFNDEEYQKIITSKIDEADNCESSALIIDMSSLVSVKRDISGNQDQNNSYQIVGISETTIYRRLVDQIKHFSQITSNSNKWIVIIVDDESLLRILLRDVRWPSFQIMEQKQKNNSRLSNQTIGELNNLWQNTLSIK